MSKGPFETGINRPDEKAAPGLLLPYQLAWLKEEAEVALAEKSRRVGLSFAEAAASALDGCKARSAGGMNVYYMSYNKEMTAQFIDDCAFWIKVFGLAADDPVEEIIQDEDRDVLTYVIKCASGFEIRTLPGKATALRSKQGRVVIDEAAFVENIDDILKAAIALLMWGGKLRVISTHDGVDNPFNQLIQDARAGKRPYAVHRITLKEAIKQNLYKRICEMKGEVWTQDKEVAWETKIRKQYGDHAKEELDVIPSNSGGRYLSRTLLEANTDSTIPVLRIERPDNWASTVNTHERSVDIEAWLEEEVAPLIRALGTQLNTAYGQDFGRHVDLSVIVIEQIQRDLTRQTAFQLELSRIPHAQQRFILEWICDRLPKLTGIAVDSTGNGEAVGEHAADVFGDELAHQVKLNDKWYSENLPAFKAAFEDGAIVIPADSDTVDDLRALQVIDGTPKLPKATGQVGRHGDAAIAHVLAYFASQQDPEIFDYRSVSGSRHAHTNRMQRDPNSDRPPAQALKQQRGVL